MGFKLNRYKIKRTFAKKLTEILINVLFKSEERSDNLFSFYRYFIFHCLNLSFPKSPFSAIFNHS